jgi:4-amino-4-deoxy-L-arabinose transferase-like glycosyltransferase
MNDMATTTDSARGVNALMLLGAAVLVVLPFALLFRTLPIGRDSGVFMYTGMLLDGGGMPYIDSWDHKGPVLYFFNALGFLLLHGPRGVIVLEGALLLAALAVSMHLWRRLLSTRLVLLAATLFMLTYYATFELGNFTESWLIPFTLVTYSLAAVFCCEEGADAKDRVLPWLCVAIGVSVAVAALTRPNNGLGLGFLACWLLAWGTNHRWRALVLMAAAFAIVMLPVMAWIFLKGAFHEFVEQYFSYSLAYAHGTTTKVRLLSAYLLSQAIFLSPLGLGLLLTSTLVWSSGPAPKPQKAKRACYWLMFSVFVVELLSQMLSGRGYLHYALLSAAPMALMFVATLHVLDGPAHRVFELRRNGAWALFLAPIALVSLMQPAQALLVSLKQGVRVPGTVKNEVAARVEKSTRPSDLVMIHGAETWLLAATERRAPTSITYYYPAAEKFRDTYQKYQSEIVRNKPLYIIESPDGCGLAASKCEGQPDLFAELRSFLQQNYSFESELHGYRFWRLRGG